VKRSTNLLTQRVARSLCSSRASCALSPCGHARFSKLCQQGGYWRWSLLSSKQCVIFVSVLFHFISHVRAA